MADLVNLKTVEELRKRVAELEKQAKWYADEYWKLKNPDSPLPAPAEAPQAMKKMFPLVHKWVEAEVESALAGKEHSLGGSLLSMLECNLIRMTEALNTAAPASKVTPDLEKMACDFMDKFSGKDSYDKTAPFFQDLLKLLEAAAHGEKAPQTESEKLLKWVRQTVHQAHHDGEIEACQKNTCGAITKHLSPNGSEAGQ